jgi:uncharacterized membrane protein YbhN (UPF0104 family)
MAKQYLRQIVLFGITLLIFLALFSQADLPQIRRTLQQADSSDLLLAAGLSLLFPVLNALRWDLIVRQLGTRLGFWESFKIVMAAWPLGTLTPAKSGDLIKVFFLRRVLQYSVTTGVILAERLLDVFVLCLYAILFGVGVRLWASVWVGGSILAGLLFLFLLVELQLTKFLPQKLQEPAVNLFLASRKIYSNPAVLLGCLLITALNWLLSLLQTWIAYRALQVAVPFDYLSAALPLAIFIGLLPITLSGMGTRDTAVIALFENYAAYETNLAVGILYSIYGYWLLTLLGLPFMRAAFAGAIRGIEGAELKQNALRSTLGQNSTD